MAQYSSSHLSPNSINRSNSNSSITSNSTIASTRSRTDSCLSTTSSQKRHGLLGKIQSGLNLIHRRFSRCHTTLTDMDIQILETVTHFTREEVLQWHEKFLADCPNGYMTPKQFISMYKSLCPKHDAERFARHVFRAFDHDKSKTVDFHEFLLGLSMTSATSSPEKKLEWTFHVFDIDGNGLLTRRECLEVIESLVRFNCALNNNKFNGNIDQILLPAKKSMMNIFDLNPNSTNQLTMSQFIQGCLNDPFIAQLLAPHNDQNLINSTDQSTEQK